MSDGVHWLSLRSVFIGVNLSLIVWLGRLPAGLSCPYQLNGFKTGTPGSLPWLRRINPSSLEFVRTLNFQSSGNFLRKCTWEIIF